MRFRIEWRDADGNVGHGFTEVDEGPLVQVRAEVQFIKAAEADGRKLWCTWSCREPARSVATTYDDAHAEKLTRLRLAMVEAARVRDRTYRISREAQHAETVAFDAWRKAQSAYYDVLNARMP